MNDCKFELLKIVKDELTVEDVERLYCQGIVTICEDGKITGFDFEHRPIYKNCG